MSKAPQYSITDILYSVIVILALILIIKLI